MEEILNVDPTFRFLYQTYKANIEYDPQTVCSMLSTFKKRLSLNWMNTFFKKDAIKSLACVFQTIVSFVDSPHASVRVTANCTVGAILLSVVPFHPRASIKAFGLACASIPLSPKISLTVILVFIYLSKFVSQVKQQEFIIAVPVLEHFRSDFTEFAKYMPQIVQNIHHLPENFQLTLLKSLVRSNESNPQTSLGASIYDITAINRAAYIPTLIHELETCPTTRLLVGPYLFGDGQMYDLLGEAERKVFVDDSTSEIAKASPGFPEFEAACKILAEHLVKNPSDKERIFSFLRPDYPNHFRRLILHLPLSFEEIFSINEKSESMKAAQLNSLTSLFLNYPDSVDADRVAEKFREFTNSENDLFCTLIESLTKTFVQFTKLCVKDHHIKILNEILKRPVKNWVHAMAMTDLIKVVSAYNTCSKFYEKLLVFSLSHTDRLAESAIETLAYISSRKTIHKLLNEILKSDWMSEFYATRRFQLLSRLIDHYEKVIFSQFIDIAFETLLVFDSLSFRSSCYKFLSKCSLVRIPDSIFSFSLDFLIRTFQSYTQKEFKVPNSQITYPIPNETYLESFDTDILSNPDLSYQTILSPLLNCFMFLTSIDVNNMKDSVTLFWACMALVPLFDKYALEGSLKIGLDKARLCRLANETFHSTSDEEVLTLCLKILVESNLPLTKGTMMAVERFLIESKTDNSDLLFYCFLLMDMANHDKAVSFLPQITKSENPKHKTEILFRLSRVIGRAILPFVTEETSLALVEMANVGDKQAITQVSNYMKNHSFEEWPIEDEHLRKELAYLIENIQSSVDLSKLNETQLRFIVEHSEKFDRDALIKYIADNPTRFSKIDLGNLVLEENDIFTFEEPRNISTNISMASNIAEGVVGDSVELICSYLRSSYSKIPLEVWNSMWEIIIKSNKSTYIIDGLNYAKKRGITVTSLPHPELLSDDALLIFLEQLRLSKEDKHIPTNVLDTLKNRLSSELAFEKLVKHPNRKLAYAVLSFDISLNDHLTNYNTSFLKFLISTVPYMNYDKLSLFTFNSNLLSLFSSESSNKRKSLILRLSTVSLNFLRNSKHLIEWRSLSNFVINLIDEIATNCVDQNFYELFKLLQAISDAPPLQEKIIVVVNFFNNQFGYKPMTLELVSYMGQTSLIDSEMALIRNSIPSHTASVIRALQYCINPSANQQTVNMVNNALKIISSNIESERPDFNITRAMVPLISMITSCGDVVQYQSRLIYTIVNCFIKDSSRAYYVDSMTCLSPFIYKIPNAFESIFMVNFCTPEVVETARDCLGQIQTQALSKRQKSNSTSLLLNSLMKLYFNSHNISIGMQIVLVSKMCNRQKDIMERLIEHFLNTVGISLTTLAVIKKLAMETTEVKSVSYDMSISTDDGYKVSLIEMILSGSAVSKPDFLSNLNQK